MATTQIDYGRAQIAAFNEAARAGVIQFDERAVREAVQLYDQMIDRLKSIRKKLGSMNDLQGFGGFPSGLQLRDGFSKKAAEGVEVVNQLIDGAMRLQEAYLRAGRLISEADLANANRIKIFEESSATNNGLQ
ncbi:hypothetical protein ACQPZ2_00910 [Nocardia pseudovaccinii]|uniref:hypothetical protein n=1 Tax=Nocardia pseudovaccinii TaxID=189540 RepID=UPI003D94F564